MKKITTAPVVNMTIQQTEETVLHAAAVSILDLSEMLAVCNRGMLRHDHAVMAGEDSMHHTAVMSEDTITWSGKLSLQSVRKGKHHSELTA